MHEILQNIIQDNDRADETIRRLRSLVRKKNLEFALLGLAAAMRESRCLWAGSNAGRGATCHFA